ncbi:hypothetical protein M2132_002036 [Dysgonomonas sp. PH5-45]|uniref:T9SS type A sorting domain-containing protein n=1 Tax=unclassified Dysgonomonas TaxID=2630389 RepID=UPI002475E20D|nr:MULTISPECIES: T9SS type A sorting domain-containing protein [unclassified Dysgonomonas]MDH6355690.1 hypothetical protein [Dysgonomonas sp. PH5-45]MDH6388587.1 hypothetical protein [Dysgonomonas sp. PH5-37]
MKKVLQSLASVMMLLLVATTVTAQDRLKINNENLRFDSEAFAKNLSTMKQLTSSDASLFKSTSSDDPKFGGCVFQLGNTKPYTVATFTANGTEPLSVIQEQDPENPYKYLFISGVLSGDKYYTLNIGPDGSNYRNTVFNANTWEEINVITEFSSYAEIPILLAVDPTSDGSRAYGFCSDSQNSGMYLIEYKLTEDDFFPVTVITESPIKTNLSTIAFDSNGSLFGIGVNGMLYEIDVTNGKMYDVASLVDPLFSKFGNGNYLPISAIKFPQGATNIGNVYYASMVIGAGSDLGSLFLYLNLEEDQIGVTLPLGKDDTRALAICGMFDYSKLKGSSINDEQANVVANVRGGENTISVEADNVEVSVYNANGQLVASKTVNGSADFSVQAGLYIVKANNQATKVLVK